MEENYYNTYNKARSLNSRDACKDHRLWGQLDRATNEMRTSFFCSQLRLWSQAVGTKLATK